jgi:hypothetical protein
LFVSAVGSTGFDLDHFQAANHRRQLREPAPTRRLRNYQSALLFADTGHWLGHSRNSNDCAIAPDSLPLPPSSIVWQGVMTGGGAGYPLGQAVCTDQAVGIASTVITVGAFMSDLVFGEPGTATVS